MNLYLLNLQIGVQLGQDDLGKELKTYPTSNSYILFSLAEKSTSLSL